MKNFNRETKEAGKRLFGKPEKITYNPYRGGAGPTKEKADNNTLYLGQLLKATNIPFTEDREYSKEMWGGDTLNLKIVKEREIAYAGYDRWGFCVDGIEEIDIDQDSPQATIEAIKKWYKPSAKKLATNYNKQKVFDDCN